MNCNFKRRRYIWCYICLLPPAAYWDGVRTGSSRFIFMLKICYSWPLLFTTAISHQRSFVVTIQHASLRNNKTLYFLWCISFKYLKVVLTAVDICSWLYFHMLTGLASQKFQWEPTQNMPAPCWQMLLLACIKMNTLRVVPHNKEKEHFSKDCQTSGKLLQEVCRGTEWRTLCTLLICHLQLWGSELMPEESVVFPITKPHTGYCL